MVHQVGSVPPIHPQHPTEMLKGQETAGQIAPVPAAADLCHAGHRQSHEPGTPCPPGLGKQQGTEALSPPLMLSSCCSSALGLLQS